jgi:signal recognition particle subunit SRP54
MGQLPGNIKEQMNDKKLVKIEAMINSMTRKERRFPDNIKPSNKRRIAAGSGTTVPDLNQLLKQFDLMQKMMRKMSKGGGMMKMMRGLQGKFPMGGMGGMGGFGGGMPGG